MSKMRCQVCGKKYGGVAGTYDHETVRWDEYSVESWTALYMCRGHGQLEVFVEETVHVEEDGEVMSTIEVLGALFTPDPQHMHDL